MWERFAPTVAVGAGGAIGALARYGLTVAIPTTRSAGIGFPWATFLANVGGCMLIGVLMTLILDVWVAHRLLRPFLGVGVLGGFTTFSTYAVETLELAGSNQPAMAIGYLVGTVLSALVAVWLGAHLTRIAVRTHRRSTG